MQVFAFHMYNPNPRERYCCEKSTDLCENKKKPSAGTWSSPGPREAILGKGYNAWGEGLLSFEYVSYKLEDKPIHPGSHPENLPRTPSYP